METRITEEILKTLAAGWYGAIGGLALYLNQIRKGVVFNLAKLITNVLLAWFIWWLIGWILPLDILGREQLIAISGFLAYPILDLMEEKWLDFLIDKVIKK